MGSRLIISVLAGLSTLVMASRPAAAEVRDPEPIFVDRATETGLVFEHFNGASGELYMPEMMGPGAALFDYDGDGDLDVYLVQGQHLGPRADPDPDLTDRLYRNDLGPGGVGGGPEARFRDVTDRAGIRATVYGMGVVAGDTDADGFPDLYLANLGPNRFLRNRGDGTFEDVTASAGSGLDDRRWSIGGSLFDPDRDGDSDLWIINYLDFGFGRHRKCQTVTGAPDYCGPYAYEGEPDLLFRNRGDGTFEPAGSEAGIADRPGASLGVVTGDIDGDRWPDVYVAIDDEPNYLWRNRGDGTFTEEALLAGLALNREGEPEASMGIDLDDVDDDGDLDLFLTHLTQETNTLYLNQGDGLFRDATVPSGLGPPSWKHTGFGTSLFDYDNDGILDILVVNGAIRIMPEQMGDPGLPLKQPKQLYRGLGGGQFEDRTDRAGPVFQIPEVSRGAAFGDVDTDGDPDVVVGNNGTRARLLVNRRGQRNHWVGIEPLATARGAVDLGTLASVRTGDRTRRRRVQSDGSYASTNDPRALVGLGGEAGPVTVELLRPDGHRIRLAPVPSDRYYRIVPRSRGER
ncbi:MAG: CRTAC1 family protein [Thermoanaerobaculia bacterium]|nr:CRTAC1 family protein [Thermoanaerobaculia bacterium]